MVRKLLDRAAAVTRAMFPRPATGSPLFPIGLVMAACGLLAVVFGITAVIQNYHRPVEPRVLPRFAPLFLALVADLAIGA